MNETNPTSEEEQAVWFAGVLIDTLARINKQYKETIVREHVAKKCWKIFGDHRLVPTSERPNPKPTEQNSP